MSELEIGDRVVMSAFHWVFEVTAIDGDDVTLRTPYGALVVFPRNTMSRTTEPFEARWGEHGPIQENPVADRPTVEEAVSHNLALGMQGASVFDKRRQAATAIRCTVHRMVLFVGLGPFGMGSMWGTIHEPCPDYSDVPDVCDGTTDVFGDTCAAKGGSVRG